MKISVVIPMYNAKDTIKSAVESVLNQTYMGPLEVIVVNDGSQDGCEKIVEELIQNNPTNRLIKLINQPNGGVSSARNTGIKEAQAEWIAFLDSDDVWFSDKLREQLDEVSKNSDIKFIGTNRNQEQYPFFGKAKNLVYKLSAQDTLFKWYPHTSTVLVKKDELIKAGLYDESRTHAEDGDLWLKVAQFSGLYVLNKNLVSTGWGKRSFGDSGLSANMPKMYQGEILALKGAKNRRQINWAEYVFFYIWLSLKFYRRLFIVRFSK